MLTLFGRKHSFCDGISRRSFLQVGALGCGLTLADLLRLQAQGSEVPKNKSVILIFLDGGPPHIDMYDMKPEAPSEVRGVFRPIKTKVPGMEISELMPKQARIADKFSIVRSLQMLGIAHTSLEPMSGFLYKDELSSVGGAPRPSFGSTVSRLRPGNAGLPAYVSLMGGRGGERPAYLGPAYQAFVPNGPGMDNLTPLREVSLDRLSDRRAMLQAFDNVRRKVDARGEVAALDACTARATNRHGERPITRPYGPQNVFATLYRALGIAPSLTLPDLSGRPMPLLEQRDPIAELV